MNRDEGSYNLHTRDEKCAKSQNDREQRRVRLRVLAPYWAAIVLIVLAALHIFIGGVAVIRVHCYTVHRVQWGVRRLISFWRVIVVVVGAHRGVVCRFRGAGGLPAGAVGNVFDHRDVDLVDGVEAVVGKKWIGAHNLKRDKQKYLILIFKKFSKQDTIQ